MNISKLIILKFFKKPLWMKIHAKYLLRPLQACTAYWITYSIFLLTDSRGALISMSSRPVFACNQRSVTKAILCAILSVQLEATFDTISSWQYAIKIAVSSQKPRYLMVRNINCCVRLLHINLTVIPAILLGNIFIGFLMIKIHNEISVQNQTGNNPKPFLNIQQPSN